MREDESTKLFSVVARRYVREVFAGNTHTGSARVGQSGGHGYVAGLQLKAFLAFEIVDLCQFQR